MKVLRLVCLSAALFAAGTIDVLAKSPNPDKIVVRWVMAGIEKDADLTRLVSIPQETILRTGYKIKMYLKVFHHCFFYLFHQGPEGQLRLIYPVSLPSEGLVSGTQLTVPQSDQWFELDGQTGTETFHVLVSSTPLHSIETLYEDYRQREAENGYQAARIISAIKRLRNQQRSLTSKAERPIPLGGTVRGDFGNITESTEKLLDNLAENIVIDNVFCRTYTIEHH